MFRITAQLAVTMAATLSLGTRGGRAQAPTNAVSRAMRDELARSIVQLRLDTIRPPYFIAYRVDEFDGTRVAASLGSLLQSTEQRTRDLAVEVRVGDYDFDNTNFLGFPSGAFNRRRSFESTGQLPLDDNYQEIRRQLWMATDQAYKDAVEQLAEKRAALQNQMPAERVPDFSRESVATTADLTPVAKLNREDVESLVRALSGLFRGMPEIFSSQVEWTGVVRHTRYVNSEGTSFERVSPWFALRVGAATQASDGMPLEDFVEVAAAAPGDLPPREVLEDSARALGARLALLRQARPGEAYDGPVLFEGQASAELFDYVFARWLVASRRPVFGNPMFERFAGRFETAVLDQIGRRVLPPFLSLTDDPTVTVYEGHYLGGYRVDDDGVRAHPTRLVDHGVLKTLLATRSPVRGVLHSTGNRWGAGPTITTLTIATDSGLSDGDLRRRLVELATARGNAYGIVIRQLARPGLAAFENPAAFMSAMAGELAGGAPTLMATLAFRVYPDGHEELIRNAEVTGITAGSFKRIVAASKAAAWYTSGSLESPGEVVSAFSTLPFSGWAGLDNLGLRHPRSYVAPSILFEDGSLRRASDAVPTLPLIPPPWAASAR